MDSTFSFNGYNFNLQRGEAIFNYELVKGSDISSFSEKISFPSVGLTIPEELLDKLFQNLSLIFGISYWKLYCPKKIVINGFSLTSGQAKFWNTVYTKGLGELFYKNKIDFRGLVNFPFDEKLKVKLTSFPRSDRTLLTIGGGKDSIVSAEMLNAESKPFDTFALGNFPIIREVSRALGKEPIIVTRELDPKLFELNKREDAFNGHVPISVFFAFLGLMSAIFYNYKYVVVSNERSANYGNVEYLGETINHQWSKSEEFEKLFQDYVSDYITGDVSYYSLLRKYSEFEIAKIFSEYKKYFPIFSSCNTNFRINSAPSSQKWCGKCAKCLFVFILLSAFISKEELLKIFGKNLFEDQSLIPTFKELLGIGVKPFECVGTPQEVKMALAETLRKGEFNNTLLMEVYKNEIRGA